MNVIAPVPQFQPSSDSTQFKPSSDSDSSSQGVGGQDFSSALHAANSKPTRKSSTTKTPRDSHGGSQLPASGNPSPVALPPSAAAPAAAANAGSKAPTPDAHPAVPVGGPVSPSTTAVTGPISAQAPAGAPAAPAAAAASTPFGQLIGQDAANPTPPVTADASPATGALPGDSALPPLVLPADAVAVADPNIAGDPVAAAAATALASAAADATTSAASLSAADKSAAAVSAAIALPVQPQPKAAATATGNDSPGAVRAANSNATAGSAGTVSSDAASATDAAAQSVMAAAAAARAAHGSSSDNVPAQSFLGAADSAGKPADASPPTVMPPPVAGAAGAAAAVAAATVANAAANARAITALADMSAAMGDKPPHENTAVSSLSATSNDGSVGAAQLLTSNILTDTPTAPTFKVAAPVETSDFSQGVSDRVSFMVDGNISSAKLQVNPPALGPIEVRIALQGAHAQVTFTSHSALTRDALESSAPKLREMLGGQGFAQVSVDVSQGSFQDRSAQSSPYQGAAASARDSRVDAAQPASRTAARVATGVLDAYA